MNFVAFERDLSEICVLCRSNARLGGGAFAAIVMHGKYCTFLGLKAHFAELELALHF